jgi:dolichyl-phosphate beta-glucosyltransferase
VIPPRWSVVIPALNEGDRLPPYLDRVVTYFEGRSEPYEVIVVDDGSSDDTIEVVQRCAREHPAVRAVALGWHQGKGAAVQRGMLGSSGMFRLFTDADGATPIEEVKRFEPALAAGADVVIGSRAAHDPSVAVVASPHRVVAGRVFNWMVGRLGLDGVSDTQCGFKLFVGHVADDLFGRLSTTGLGFDVELLLLARAAGYRIAEVPVNWTDQPGGKVGVLRHGLGMVLEIVKARWRLKACR